MHGFMKRALECVSAYTSSCVTILSQLLTCKTLLLSNVLFLLTTNTLSNKACVNKSIVCYNMNKKILLFDLNFSIKLMIQLLLVLLELSNWIVCIHTRFSYFGSTGVRIFFIIKFEFWFVNVIYKHYIYKFIHIQDISRFPDKGCKYYLIVYDPLRRSVTILFGFWNFMLQAKILKQHKSVFILNIPNIKKSLSFLEYKS